MAQGYWRTGLAGVLAGIVFSLLSILTFYVLGDLTGILNNPAIQSPKVIAVARFSVGTTRFLPEGYRIELAEVNGQEAVIVRVGGQVLSVLTIEVEAEHIRAIYVMANPEDLTRVA